MVQGHTRVGSNEELEVVLVSADEYLVTRKAWEELSVLGCQEERSNNESWPGGSTEAVVAFEVALERSRVEQEHRQWHEPGGRVADYCVSQRASATACTSKDLVPLAVGWPLNPAGRTM